ncbi:nucleoside diphosphate kinase, mitochondrial-like [Vulpes lagopus]|uniref:nucleoside diphosphate kinase, mitochondrial-like n=1 Tax=Vulpes lagopus TaxID=494514 RepID=UPI001BC9C4E3|nr:nucleoside diphosphate kinase, mitochondrial-like [Vulpes lagopus]
MAYSFQQPALIQGVTRGSGALFQEPGKENNVCFLLPHTERAVFPPKHNESVQEEEKKNRGQRPAGQGHARRRLGARPLPGLLSGPRAPRPSLLARPNSGGSSWTRERTLAAVKPDGVQRRLVGNVIPCFERRGFKLVGMKMLQAPERVLVEHYHDLQRKPFYPALISYMTSGPMVALVWEGPNVVCSSRTMIGHTDSAEAAPGTIRGDFSIHISRNIIHASDSVEKSPREIQLWFQSSELVDWADEKHESSIYAA